MNYFKEIPISKKEIMIKRTLKVISSLLLLSTLVACGGGGSTSGTPTNTPPIASARSAVALQDNNAVISLLATDIDGDLLNYAIATQPQNGTLSLLGNSATYTPNSGFSGSDSFTFTTNDGTVDSNTATVDITVSPSSTITGIVSKIDGNLIDGVSIKVLDSAGLTLSTHTSTSTGSYEVKAKTGSKLVLAFTKAGFVKQVKTMTTPSVKNLSAPMSITMLEAGTSQNIDISSATQVNGSSGATVKLLANSFVDASGNPVTGNIDVVITPVDVSDSTILSSFPGEFSGISESTGNQVAIVSAGTTYFDFSQGGEPLQLANGMTAEIELPIFLTTNPVTGNPIELGDTIELWYLNETTGVWVQEGTGTVVVNTSSPTGYALNADVTHFTPWNVDFPVEIADLAITINGSVNGGVATVKTRTTDTAWGWMPSASPIIIGSTQNYSIFPWNGETCVWLEYTDNTGAAATSPEQCLTNIVANASYSMLFNVATAGSLVLFNPYSRNSYRINQSPSILFASQSLESNVSYSITAGALPAGMSLNPYGTTKARITGSSTVLGSYSVTVKGTDSDGFSDTKTVSFDIVNPPPPSLYSSTYFHYNSGDMVSNDLSGRINNSTSPATTWIITQSDGTAVPTGITITSAGVLNITSFDGNDVVYKVTAYNIYGASNIMDVFINGPSAPIISSSITISYFMGDTNTIMEQLTVTNASATATSWSISNHDGSPVASTISITNTGNLVIDRSTGLPDLVSTTLKAIATNAVGNSNGMTVSFFADQMGGGPPCTGGPLLCP